LGNSHLKSPLVSVATGDGRKIRSIIPRRANFSDAAMTL
jgi:hypothetical protein